MQSIVCVSIHLPHMYIGMCANPNIVYRKYFTNHCQNGVSEMFVNKTFAKETLQGGH